MWRSSAEGAAPVVEAKPARIVQNAVFCAAIAAIGFLEAWLAAERLQQTSDSAQSFVEGGAILGGNVLLSGWNVPLDGYYFTDTLPYAALEALFGQRPVLLALVPALTYALFVFLGATLCLEAAREKVGRAEVMASAALLLAVPAWTGTWNPLLLSDMHFASVVGALAALALCARFTRAPSLPTGVGLFLITVATLVSDPFSLVFAFGPALALLAIELLRGPRARNLRLACLILASGVALGLALPSAIAFSGGFTVESIVVWSIVAPAQFLCNLAALAGGLATLFGVNPAGAPFSFVGLLFVMRGAAFVIALAALAGTTRRLFERDASLLDRMLCAGVLCTLVACAVSAQFGKGIAAETLWQGGPPMRYVMPAALFTVLLGARRLPAMIAALPAWRAQVASRTALVLSAMLVVLAGGSQTIAAAPVWIDDNPPLAAANWLARRGLTDGEGEYWSANLLTAMSGNTIHVRSVVSDDGRLVPYILAADGAAYRRPAQFVVWQEPNKTALVFADVRATHAICSVEMFEGYHIAILASPGRTCRRGPLQ